MITEPRGRILVAHARLFSYYYNWQICGLRIRKAINPNTQLLFADVCGESTHTSMIRHFRSWMSDQWYDQLVDTRPRPILSVSVTAASAIPLLDVIVALYKSRRTADISCWEDSSRPGRYWNVISCEACQFAAKKLLACCLLAILSRDSVWVADGSFWASSSTWTVCA